MERRPNTGQEFGSTRSQGAWFRGAGGVHPPPTARRGEQGGALGLRAVRSGAPLRVRPLRPGTQPGDLPGAQSCRPPRGAPCHAHRPRAPAPRAPLQGGEWAEPRCPFERPPAAGPAPRPPPSAAARSPPPLGSRGSHTPAGGVTAPAIPGCTSVSSRRRSRAGSLPISSVPSHHQPPGPFWRVLKVSSGEQKQLFVWADFPRRPRSLGRGRPLGVPGSLPPLPPAVPAYPSVDRLSNLLIVTCPSPFPFILKLEIVLSPVLPPCVINTLSLPAQPSRGEMDLYL